jgi:hypothetical protein
MSPTTTPNELWLTCHNLTSLSKDVFRDYPGLTLFGCNKNHLRKLPAIPNTVTSLFCNNNHLTQLPKLPSRLRVLNCAENGLLSLKAIPNTLCILHCSGNGLTEMPDLPLTIQTLSLYDNPLEENYPDLDLSRGLVQNVAETICYINNCNRIRRAAEQTR